ncbi:MAG: hypothetical protein M1814_001992 [Vezdaea aestivalis]|nr:MAG: hypothetical protein M1814_001992 [Vezdaea aestivalis]
MNSDNEPVILMLDLPINGFGGIDLLSFTSSPKFRGFRTVPYGWHFLYTGASSEFSLRHGSWVNLVVSDSSRPVIVKKWNMSEERLDLVTAGPFFDTSVSQIKGLWKEGLAPYTQSSTSSAFGSTALKEESEDWPRLSSFLSDRILRRITGAGPTDVDLSLTSASCFFADREAIPGISEDEFEQSELFFMPIDLKESWGSGVVGRERTLAAQDRSFLLNYVIEKHCSDMMGLEILGEFQFAFIMILTLNNFSCMEHWKRIFRMMLSCKKDINTRHTLFAEFLVTLKLQLKHCGDVDEGLFDLSDEGGGLLREAIMGFKRSVESSDEKVHEDVVGSLEDLLDFVKSTIGWTMDDSYARKGFLDLEDGERVEMEVTDLEADDEEGEYAPVVVELADTIPSNEHRV